MSAFAAFEQWADRITHVFPLRDQCPVAEGEVGAWMIRPSHQIVEAGLVLLLSGGVFVGAARAFRARLAAAPTPAPLARYRASVLARLLDVLLPLLLSISLATVVYHKYHGGKLVYLLQPCHVMHTLLLVIFAQARHSRLGAVLFAVYVHLLVGPALGSVPADLSCYKQRFEALNWGVQHALLLLAPLHLLATRRFEILRGSHVFYTAFAAMNLFHYGVLLPMSVLTGTNLNYMLCPPASVKLLVMLGRWYRIVLLFACALIAITLRYGVVEAFLRCVGEDACTKKSAAKVADADEAEAELASSKRSSSKRAEIADGVPHQRAGHALN